MTQLDSYEATPVPVAQVVRPLVTAEEGKRDWEEYIRLCNALLAPTDYQHISGKLFKKKSAWRKLAKAFAISDRIEEYHIERDARGWPIYATYVVEAESPAGQTAVGYHEAHVQERCCPAAFGKTCSKKGKSQHVCCPAGCDGSDHWSHPGDIPATAHTRAKNRAIADLIGAGEVSAEEMQDEAPSAEEMVSPSTHKQSAKPKRSQRPRQEPSDQKPVIVRHKDGTEHEMAWDDFVARWDEAGYSLEDLTAIVGSADSDAVTAWFGEQAGRTIGSLKTEAAVRRQMIAEA